MKSDGPKGKGLGRRDFLRLVGGGAAAAGLIAPFSACSLGRAATNKKVIVLGLDGMDPNIIERMWSDPDLPDLPNFRRLAEAGGFSRLGTSVPPQSPVAWSNFITGMDSGGHGIADFVHRDPQTYNIAFSGAEIVDPDSFFSLGDVNIPLGGGGVYNLRKGRPFWGYITERGISAVVIKVPANFPPDDEATRSISGLGTPDVLGGYGTFSYYTSNGFESYADQIGSSLPGGRITYVDVIEGAVEAELIGPENNLRARREPTFDDEYPNNVKVPFAVYVDPEPDVNRVARIDIQGKRILLRQGEYSDWVRVNFEMMPVIGSVGGICRFYLMETYPNFRLYVTPINIDPAAQALPVTHPGGYGAELAREIGPFWTKGLPADTKALDNRVFEDRDYARQAQLILDERMRMFDYEWERFRDGLLFFYVSSTDQDTHMFWRSIDESHPLHAESDPALRRFIFDVYERMDRMVGRVMERLDDDSLLLILSDHGFASFAKEFHLNAWLRRHRYLSIKPEAAGRAHAGYRDVDWSRTSAYAIGLNGLYINLRGREGQGSVDPAEAEEIKTRLKRELEAWRDPETGERPVYRVYRREEVYSGPEMETLPDLIVGYDAGYRISGTDAQLQIGPRILAANQLRWSGDHCMAAEVVPGILFSSRPLELDDPRIVDLPVTILAEFGIERPEQMRGRNIFGA